MGKLKTDIVDAFSNIPVQVYMIFWLSVFFQFLGGVMSQIGRILSYIGFFIISVIIMKYYCSVWAFKIRNYADRKYPSKNESNPRSRT